MNVIYGTFSIHDQGIGEELRASAKLQIGSYERERVDQALARARSYQNSDGRRLWLDCLIK